MIKIPLQFDLTNNKYGPIPVWNNAAIDLKKGILTEFFNASPLISNFFLMPEEWGEGENPYLILKGTEDSLKGGYLIYADTYYQADAGNDPVEYYALKVYYCPNMNEISISEKIYVGPLTSFYNPNLSTKKANNHKSGDPELCIIPISTNCTSLIFTFNDMLNSCGMINIFKNKGHCYINIITNGSDTDNWRWLPNNFQWDGDTGSYSRYNLIRSVDLFNTKTGRTYCKDSLGKTYPVPIFQSQYLGIMNNRKYFPLMIGDQFVPDIWFCDGGQPFHSFLREVVIDDVKYFTLWKNILIKNNELDNILLGD